MDKSSVKDKISSLETLSGILKTLELNCKQNHELEKDAQKKQEFLTQIQYLEKQQKDTCSEISSHKEKLLSIEQLQNTSSTKNFPIPTFGDNSTFKSEEVLILCTSFNGLDDKESFTTFYRKLCSYITNNKLTEEVSKSLLSGLLRNEAFDCFYEARNESFSDIVSVLYNRFSQPKSLFHHLQKLKSLKRGDNESLLSIMHKINVLLDLSAPMFPKEQQEPRKMYFLTEYLYKFANSEARKALREKQLKNSRLGIISDYNELLDLAVFAEEDSSNDFFDSSHSAHTSFIATPAEMCRDRIRSRRESGRISPYRRPISPSANAAYDSSRVNSREPSPAPPPFQKNSSFAPQNNTTLTYSPPPPQKLISRSVSPPPKFISERENRYNESGQSRPFRYNYLATSQLRELISKLTEIFNILNDPPPSNSR